MQLVCARYYHNRHPHQPERKDILAQVRDHFHIKWSKLSYEQLEYETMEKSAEQIGVPIQNLELDKSFVNMLAARGCWDVVVNYEEGVVLV